jgi:hypothetical protein
MDAVPSGDASPGERRVRVIIKNPSADKEEGEHVFQTSVPLSWSVDRLKQHLHYRYPDHPAPELQRVRVPSPARSIRNPPLGVASYVLYTGVCWCMEAAAT